METRLNFLCTSFQIGMFSNKMLIIKASSQKRTYCGIRFEISSNFLKKKMAANFEPFIEFLSFLIGLLLDDAGPSKYSFNFIGHKQF